MSDDRFDDAATQVEPHVIRTIAYIPLVLTAGGWVVEEDPVAVLDRDDLMMVCSREGHLDSAVDRAACEIARERARGLPLPSPRDVAEAFDRAAVYKRHTVLGGPV